MERVYKKKHARLVKAASKLPQPQTVVESQPGCSSDPVAKDNQQCIPIALEDMITDLSCGDGDEEMQMERELVAGMQT